MTRAMFIVVLAHTALLLQTVHADFTTLVSVKSDLTTSSSNVSFYPSVSQDGRYIVFESTDPNLVDGDTNGIVDIFRHDRKTGETIIVNLAYNGSLAAGGSTFGRISGDGNVVVFASYASNLVPNDLNGKCDLFVRDLIAGSTTQITPSSAVSGDFCVSANPSVSADGRYIAYYGAFSTAPGSINIIIYDRQTGMNELVPPNSGSKQVPNISANGQFVTFYSDDATFVAGDTNATHDVFVYDRQNPGALQRVSIGTGGQANGSSVFPDISADGRYVVFESFANNLVPGLPGAPGSVRRVYVRDRVAGITELVSVPLSGVPDGSDAWYPAISGDGRYVTFGSLSSAFVANDTNGAFDCFKYDRMLHKMSIVTANVNGASGNGATHQKPCDISEDGTTVSFSSTSTNITAMPVPTSPSAWRIFAFGSIYSPWQNLDSGLAGTGGKIPALHAEGVMQIGTPLALSILGKPNAAGYLIAGGSQISAPLFGGVFVPSPDVLIPITLDSQGRAYIVVPWSFTLPTGAAFWLQSWFTDSGAVQGMSASNAIKGIIQ
jgi:Tol biopolymer transport system component